MGWYCWWTKSCTTKDDDYPIIYRVLTIPGGAGFRPSTVLLYPKVLFWTFHRSYRDRKTYTVVTLPSCTGHDEERVLSMLVREHRRRSRCLCLMETVFTSGMFLIQQLMYASMIYTSVDAWFWNYCNTRRYVLSSLHMNYTYCWFITIWHDHT